MAEWNFVIQILRSDTFGYHCVFYSISLPVCLRHFIISWTKLYSIGLPVGLRHFIISWAKLYSISLPVGLRHFIICRSWDKLYSIIYLLVWDILLQHNPHHYCHHLHPSSPNIPSPSSSSVFVFSSLLPPLLSSPWLSFSWVIEFLYFLRAQFYQSFDPL